MATDQKDHADLALIKRDTVDIVADRVRTLHERGELHLPANYSAENAMKSAWLKLQATFDKERRLALTVCTRDSVANSLLDMVVQGLNPAKNQCYFIAYGQTLVCQRSYFGDLALVKRVRPDAQVYFRVVYEGDVFEYHIERGQLRIEKHIQALANIEPAKIAAAYCVIEDGEGRIVNSVLMTLAQIKGSWRQSHQYNPNGGSTPHHAFPDQMALRTVIRRACKAVINESSDDYLLLDHVNRSDEQQAEAQIHEEVASEANGLIIDVDAPAPNGSAAGGQPASGDGGAGRAEPPAASAAGQDDQLTLDIQPGPGF